MAVDLFGCARCSNSPQPPSADTSLFLQGSIPIHEFYSSNKLRSVLARRGPPLAPFSVFLGEI